MTTFNSEHVTVTIDSILDPVVFEDIKETFYITKEDGDSLTLDGDDAIDAIEMLKDGRNYEDVSYQLFINDEKVSVDSSNVPEMLGELEDVEETLEPDFVREYIEEEGEAPQGDYFIIEIGSGSRESQYEALAEYHLEEGLVDIGDFPVSYIDKETMGRDYMNDFSETESYAWMKN